MHRRGLRVLLGEEGGDGAFLTMPGGDSLQDHFQVHELNCVGLKGVKVLA
jgi:hypothetical protein